MGNKLEWRVRISVDEHGDATGGNDYADKLTDLVERHGLEGNEFELVRWINEYEGHEAAEWNGSKLAPFDYSHIEPSATRQREAKAALA